LSGIAQSDSVIELGGERLARNSAHTGGQPENRWQEAGICGFDVTDADELTLTWHCKKNALFYSLTTC
jgi:hypothetical protein